MVEDELPPAQIGPKFSKQARPYRVPYRISIRQSAPCGDFVDPFSCERTVSALHPLRSCLIYISPIIQDYCQVWFVIMFLV
jgi:hypothetical protein